MGFLRIVRGGANKPALRQCARAIIPFPIRAGLYKFFRNRRSLYKWSAATSEKIFIWMKAIAILGLRRAHLIGPALDLNSLAAFQLVLQNAEPVRTSTSGCLLTCCGALYPGGAERQVINTLRGLADFGLRDRLLMLADHLTPNQAQRFDFYLPMLHEANITAREIRHAAGTGFKAKRLPPTIRAAVKHLPLDLKNDVVDLYREFVEIQPAVVHAWLDWSNVRAGIAAVLAGVPRIILSGRNLNPSNFFFNAPYMRPAYQALSQHSNVIFINNSEAGAADYADWIGVPRERVGVVRNGVDFPDAARPSPQAVQKFRALLGVSDGGPLVGGLFRLSPEKRPDLWIEAACVIAAARPDCRFAIFGAGPMREEMLTLAAARGLGTVLMIRDVIEEPLVALAAFDVCLLTSIAEGTSNVALEAQWIGTPVVATAGGGTQESLDIGGSGWLIDQPDADTIANAVLRVLADPKCKSTAAEKGPRFIASRFGTDRMILDTMQLYGLAAKPLRSGSDRDESDGLGEFPRVSRSRRDPPAISCSEPTAASVRDALT